MDPRHLTPQACSSSLTANFYRPCWLGRLRSRSLLTISLAVPRAASALLLAACLIFQDPVLLAQSNAEVTEDLRATLQANGQGILLQWWGKAGRTYFVQTSPTLNLGVDWSYEGHVLTGTGAFLSVSLPAQPSPSFIRLRYTDQPVTGDPYEADPDQDGLSNREEIQTHGTNPLDPDSDDDGMPDGWEHRHGLDFNDARDADLVLDPALTQAQRAELMDIKQAGVVMSYPEDYAASWGWSQLQWEWMRRIDPDHDGWTNLEEFLSGTDPRVADTTYLRVRRGGVQSATAGQGLPEPFVVQAIREVMGAGGMRSGFTALADEEVTFSGPADMLFIQDSDEPSLGANPLTLRTDDAGYVHVRAQAPSQAGRHTIFVRLGSGREAALSLEVQPPQPPGTGGGPGDGPGSPQPNPEFTLQWQHVWRSASVQGSNSTGGFSNHRTQQKAAAPGVQPQRAGAEAGYPSMSSPAGHYGHNDSDFAQRDPQRVETWRILYDPAWREYWSSDFGTTYVQDWHKSAPPLIAESILAIPFESFSPLLWTQARDEHVFGLSRSRVGPWIEGEENGETVRGREITASTTQYRARLVAMKDGQPVVLPQGTTLALLVMETVTQFDTETGAGVATETRIRKTVQMVIPPGASTSTPIETEGLMSPAAPNTEKLLRLLPIEVKVNDTADAKDDMVRKEQKIGSTAWRQWIPCTVKIPESGPGKTITSIGVTAESGTMKFVQDSATPPTHTTEGAANVAVTLDAQGQGKFWITGITQSANKGDAKLQIRKNGATGDVLATQSMTVFWFDSTIKAEATGNANDTAIALSADKKTYGIVLGNGMDITATASVVPAGLDHTVKQIADWQLGIMQNVTTTRTWRGKNTVNGVETKAKGVYQTTDRLDTLQPAPEIIMQISEIGGAQKFEATRPATSDTVDPPFMPADDQIQTHNGAWLKWYESDMQDTFTIWSGLIEVTNGNRGTVFIPIKQNDWKAHGNSSQQNQKATPSTGDGAQPTKVPSTQRPTAVDHIGDPNNTAWSVENN